ncbi:MAG: 4-hydroxy-tetrahydrodipicolinate synthase [Eubacterium sp.]|nr:4-hydroxy-tetrahydrodipicolinate synthase [Eubacterium sp.]MBQ7199817.1 4-hydroxy-tetrahydrodipicolinate synthase [Eubacterium sp.]MBR0119446.1 4-hydroxy-tetrahydrodipicolinate synthase [Eubacterium sp.]
MSIFEGAGVALITPMNADGSVNYDKLEELLEMQIAGGTDAIISCGTTGEASTLSEEEHIECIRFTCEKVKGRIPVVAGTGSNSTYTALQLSKEAKDAGADALLLVTPYYNKATQAGLVKHFGTIAGEVGLPVILYNIPGRTGMKIEAETIMEMRKEYSNIVGVKDATGDMAETVKVLSLSDGKIDVYSGNDDITVPIMSVGGKGVISVLSDILPKETHDMVKACLDGDFKTGAAMQLKYYNLIQALFGEVNPIPVKKAMNFMGLDVGPLRLPLTEMSDAKAAILKEEMIKVGISVK